MRVFRCVIDLRDVVRSSLRDGFVMAGSSSINRQRPGANIFAIPLSAIDELVRYSQNGTCGIREKPIGKAGVKMPAQIGSGLDAENY
jgi:hypothetical protein